MTKLERKRCELAELVYFADRRHLEGYDLSLRQLRRLRDLILEVETLLCEGEVD